MGKKRVSLTLDEELVDRVDSEADKQGLNRSQKIENMLADYFSGRSINTAVVFCGDEENKTLDLYSGKPVLGHILDNLSQEGISRAILLAGSNEDEIREQFGSQHKHVAIEYVKDKAKGTATALSKVRERLDETFVALNGHVVADVDLDDMLAVHREEETPATMALTTVKAPSKYGVARLKGRKILGFEEKPETGKAPSQLINAGTYIFEPVIFEHLDSPSLEIVFERLADEGLLSGYIYGGRWTDVDL